MTIVQKCMAIMSIIITEEDLCKKHAKKCAKICQFSSLPSKCFQAANDPNSKNDSKPHISPYNYNTCTGFRVHKNIWGRRRLSSALMVTSIGCPTILFPLCFCHFLGFWSPYRGTSDLYSTALEICYIIAT